MKHELNSSVRAKYQVLTGSQTYHIWETEDLKKIRSITNTGGWAWWKIYNILKKKIPLLQPQGTPIFYNFDKLYYLKEFLGKKKAYRYDINKAYRTILTPLVLNFCDKKEIDYIFNLKQKKHFNHAVGYCGYHKQVIEIETGEIIQEKTAERPDLLAFCTNYLFELKKAYKKEFGAFFFMFVDAFSFDYKQNMKELEAFSTLILKNYYEKNNLSDIFEKSKTKITYKEDIFETQRDGTNLKMWNPTEVKNYLFLRK